MKTTHTLFRSLTVGVIVFSMVSLPLWRPTGVLAMDPRTKIAIDLELANKADLGHVHRGEDITSGKVRQEFIDDAITRDHELAAAIETVRKEMLQTIAQKKPAETPSAVGADEINMLLKRIQELEETVFRLAGILQGISRSGNNIVMSGVNLQLVNGSGKTDGAVNGLGNLIVGYNEPQRGESQRNGSHNVVVGAQHNYSSYGGLVAGMSNTVSAPYATVSGGTGNMATAAYASVSGGQHNRATARFSSVSGGLTRQASEELSWRGGELNSSK